MGINKIIVGFLLLLILFDVSNASIVLNFRKLAGEPPNVNAIAPSPNPSIVDKVLNPNSTKDADKSSEKKPSDSLAPNNSSESEPKKSNSPEIPNNSTSVEPKGSNNTNSVSQTNTEKNEEKPKGDEGMKNLNNNNTMVPVSPPVANKTDTDTGKDREKKDDKKTDSQPVGGEACGGLENRCRDQKALVACIRSFDSGSREVVVLVQNEGESQLKVELTTQPYMGNRMKGLTVSSHQIKMMNVAMGESSKLVLNAGYGECVLPVGPPVSAGNFFLNLPSYDKLLTPINGAYFLIVSVLVLGVAWACCIFRKRERRGEIPYQELEMGVPESNTAIDVETAEGWDESWDDDWDEDKAVRSPGGDRAGSISANGLTSRSPTRDGWEDSWDD